MPQMLPHKSLRSLLPGLLSAATVFILCWLIFWIKDYAPFGTGTLATQDAYIQYVDFLPTTGICSPAKTASFIHFPTLWAAIRSLFSAIILAPR